MRCECPRELFSCPCPQGFFGFPIFWIPLHNFTARDEKNIADKLVARETRVMRKETRVIIYALEHNTAAQLRAGQHVGPAKSSLSYTYRPRMEKSHCGLTNV